MNHIQLNSSFLKSVAFKNGVMHVMFKDNVIFEYLGITEKDFNDLVNAESPGRHFKSMKLKGCKVIERQP